MGKKDISAGKLFRVSSPYPSFRGISHEFRFTTEGYVGTRGAKEFILGTKDIVVCIEAQPYAINGLVFYNMLFLHPEHGRCIFVGRNAAYIELVETGGE